jgi:hypothetical protein
MAAKAQRFYSLRFFLFLPQIKELKRFFHADSADFLADFIF